jgi:hypothetical protein
MINKQTVILNKLSTCRAETVANSRFFKNDRVMVKDLIKESVETTNKAIQCQEVLCIQDTSEINYQRHDGRLSKEDSELGPVGNNIDTGFFVHPTLVVDAKNLFPIGYSSIIVWNRSYEKLDKYQRKYKTIPIEDKESYRWILSGKESKNNILNASHLTIIGDRESDIYEEFVQIPDENTDIIVRSRDDRYIYKSKQKLYELLSKQKICGEYELEIVQNKKKNRSKHKAHIEVRYCKVKIQCPQKLKKANLPEYIELTGIEVKEHQRTVPKGEAPILWRLLTTYTVENFEEAIRIINWYKARWLIEELFRTIKKQGLNIEASQLENGKGLKKLTVMALRTAVKILQLKQEREGEGGIKADVVFTKEEVLFGLAINKKLEGDTEKQKNPYASHSLAWMAWIIARLGGWNGYKSESPPGVITFKYGLDRFNTMIDGWNIFSN